MLARVVSGLTALGVGVHFPQHQIAQTHIGVRCCKSDGCPGEGHGADVNHREKIVRSEADLMPSLYPTYIVGDLINRRVANAGNEVLTACDECARDVNLRHFGHLRRVVEILDSEIAQGEVVPIELFADGSQHGCAKRIDYVRAEQICIAKDQ